DGERADAEEELDQEERLHSPRPPHEDRVLRRPAEDRKPHADQDDARDPRARHVPPHGRSVRGERAEDDLPVDDGGRQPAGADHPRPVTTAIPTRSAKNSWARQPCTNPSTSCRRTTRSPPMRPCIDTRTTARRPSPRTHRRVSPKP